MQHLQTAFDSYFLANFPAIFNCLKSLVIKNGQSACAHLRSNSAYVGE
jgi:hypothetical protein